VTGEQRPPALDRGASANRGDGVAGGKARIRLREAGEAVALVLRIVAAAVALYAAIKGIGLVS
jgi:hypothetical protein